MLVMRYSPETGRMYSPPESMYVQEDENSGNSSNHKSVLQKTPLKVDRKCCVKLLSTALNQALTPNQLRDLYIYVTYTVQNYLGRPSASCMQDIPELYRFANQICPELSAKEKDTLAMRASILEPPEVTVFVEVIEAILSEELKMEEDFNLFCSLGTSETERSVTTKKPLSFNPKWKEHFTFPAKEFKEAVLTVKIWAAPKPDGAPILLGEANQDLQMIPCTGDELWLFLGEHRDDSTNTSYITLRCCLQVDCKANRLSVIHRHLLMCRVCFQHELRTSKRLYLDILSAGSTFPSYVRRGLYEHGLSNVLSSSAVTFLHQHALQSGLSPWENEICCWIVAEHFYRSGYDVNTGVVHALLHEVTILGSCPQKPLEPELKAFFLMGIDLSVSRCCFWLRGIHSHLEHSESRSEKELQHVVRYLIHMEAFYISDAVEKAKQALQLGSKQWIMKSLPRQDSQTQSWRSVADATVKFLMKIVDLLKVADPIFWSEWRVKFTDIVSKSIDEALEDALGPVMSEMAEQLAVERQKYSRGTVNHLVQIYIGVRKLGVYIVEQLPPVSSREILSIESCHEWVGSGTFYMYLRQKAEESTPWLISWIEREGATLTPTCEKDAFYKLMKQLLRAWKELIWPDPKSSTVALVQVVKKFTSFCCQRISSYVIDQNFFCVKDPFIVTPELCSALCKRGKMVKCIWMVKDEIESRVAAVANTDILDPLDNLLPEVNQVNQSLCGKIMHKIKQVIDSRVSLILSGEEGVSAKALLDLKNYCSDIEEIFNQQLTKAAKKEVGNHIISLINGTLKSIGVVDKMETNRHQKLVFVLQTAFNSFQK